MPSTWRVHVIEAALVAEGFRMPVADCDVYSLPAAARTAVVDILIAERASFPMVMVYGRVVCHGGVDLDAVIRAVREGASDACGCC
ncbi:MAG: hypothetical protein VB139_07345 [Coriobacteriia bacterium]|nr:hypothetical protein [Coriobacteriia bacterium]